jgi:hypothetical protein
MLLVQRVVMQAHKIAVPQFVVFRCGDAQLGVSTRWAGRFGVTHRWD